MFKRKLTGMLYTLLGLGLALLAIWIINKLFLDHQIMFRTEDTKKFELPENLQIEKELEHLNQTPGL